MGKSITLYEGECESSIIEWLKIQGYLFGRMHKIVLSEIKNINRTLNMINKNTVVTVVMDCDILSSGKADLKRLRENIKYLIENSKKIRVITQNKNLEDELVKALELKSLQRLYSHFDATNKSTYKQKLAKMIPNKLDLKLSNLDLKIFWSNKILSKYYDQKEIYILNCELKDIK